MKTVRLLLGLFIIVGGIYTAYQVVPVYMSNYELQDTFTNEAKMAAYATDRSEQDIREAVMKKVKELQIPMGPEDLKVKKEGRMVSISADYTVPVTLPGYTLRLSFHPAAQMGG